jgi:o-succinylbenzoate synthase
VEAERLEVVPYALPFKTPYVTARGRLDRRELVLVKLHSNGLVGLGETTALSLRGDDSFEQIVEQLRSIRLGRGGSSQTSGGASMQAFAALEMAQIDLAGKMAGEPAWRTLGAAAPRPIECNATLSAGPPADVARQAAVWANRGFRTFKLKVGMDGDVAQVAAASSALPPDAKVRVDANGAWSVDEAAARLAAMGPLELAEQPVATVAELRELRERTDVPLAADESLVTRDDARRVAHTCRYATVKLAKVGGIGAAAAIARELPVYLSSALDGPVGIAAAAHLAHAIPDAGLAHGLATSLLFSETIGRGPELRGPMLHVSEAPGLGVELDEDALARLALD